MDSEEDERYEGGATYDESRTKHLPPSPIVTSMHQTKKGGFSKLAES